MYVVGNLKYELSEPVNCADLYPEILNHNFALRTWTEVYYKCNKSIESFITCIVKKLIQYYKKKFSCIYRDTKYCILFEFFL